MQVWEQHDLLFHYTSQSGIKGILEAQSLHATHFGAMNDSNEMFQLKSKLVEMFQPITTRAFEELSACNKKIEERIEAEGGIKAVAEHDASRIVDVLYKVTFGLDRNLTFYQPFVVSFCAHKEEYERKNGILSQWRAYSKDSGYALVFDAKALVELLKRECEVHLYDFWGAGDVVYDGASDLFAQEFKELIEAVNRDGPRLLRGEGGSFTDGSVRRPGSKARSH